MDRAEKAQTSCHVNIRTGTNRPGRRWVIHIGVRSKVNRKTGHEGPEGEWRYSSILSLTSALEGVGCLTPRPGRITLGKDPVPIVNMYRGRECELKEDSFSSVLISEISTICFQF